MKNIINQSILLSKKYDVVVTNPPYMGNNSMNPNLKDYIKSNFPLTKTDLFAVFLEKGLEMIKDYGFNCMVTMQSWMFLSSFEKFRKKLIETTTISNLLHMDNMVMRIAFGTSATVFRKINLRNYNSTFYHVKLSDVENDIVNPLFFNDKNKFVTNSLNFDKIPGIPIAYWASKDLIKTFEKGVILKTKGDTRQGMATSDNKRFLRLWWEVNSNKISFGCKNSQEALSAGKKWHPYNKGGSFCKWYGNQEYLVNYENDGFELKEYASKLYKTPTRTIKSIGEYFKKCISWSKISSGNSSFRYYPNGFIFDVAGCCIFFDDEKLINYTLGFLNSNVSKLLLSLISPTINYEAGHIASLPLIFTNEKNLNFINNIIQENIEICKFEWDKNETSWNFKNHPLIIFNTNNIKNNLESYIKYKNKLFNSLKNNEIELNKIYSEIYDVNVNENVDDKYISITLPNYKNIIKSFISFAVGCMFGRYSLDNEGLQYAGGKFNINNYCKFIPDEDNIIPVLDTAYFEDDIVGRFVEFVKTCFGEEHLEENLDFIANALTKNKKSSRDKIRDYLLKNFFNDHKKTYKKCPIYWQFSSGKENGFNCLVYMHRYEPTLVARIRTDYLHKTQKAIEQAIINCDNIINNSSSNTEISKATKDKTKLQKQLKETQEYDEALAHIANQNIEIDLDDGVKINYAKFQNIKMLKEGEKSKKINLLKKI